MKTLSKYFKLDTIDTNQTLKPIIVITDVDDNILFTLAQDQDEIFDTNGNFIDIINCISKVSNIKISNDYDTKTLKINRLRCSLYNYYDINTKLSQYVNTNMLNKNLYLFYKSPTTNIINLSDTLNDSDCAFIYAGEISRVNFNKDKIDITAEDKTQIKIADKQVPFMSIDKLPIEERERIIGDYASDNATVPMTFGKIDKAPVLPYIDINNDRHLNILLDAQRTSGNHITAKIPSLLDTQPNDSKNCLYIKTSDDYITLDHQTYTVNEQNQLFSNFKLLNLTGVNNDYVVPEIQTGYSEGALGLWDFTGFYQRMVKSVSASEGSLLDIIGARTNFMSNETFENLEVINDNNGYEKKWIRQGDEVISGINNFDTGIRQYSGQENAGEGRWILLQLDKGISNELINLNIDNIKAGNTFVLADWLLYQNEDLISTPNHQNLITGDTTGFFISPIVPTVWRDIIPNINSGSEFDDGFIKLNAIVLENEEQLSIMQEEINSDNPDFSLLKTLVLPNLNQTNRYCPYQMHKHHATNGGARYWGSYGSNNGLNEIQDLAQSPPYRELPPSWIKINGLYYGDIVNFNTSASNEFNNIAIFEYKNPNLYGSFEQGLRMNNIGFLQYVKIENILEEEIYASITGRRNEFYTSQLDYNYVLPSNEILLPEVNFEDIRTPQPDYTIFGRYIRDFFNWYSKSQVLAGGPEATYSGTAQDDFETIAAANSFINNFINFTYEADLEFNTDINSEYYITNNTYPASYILFKDFVCNIMMLPLKLLQIVDGVTLCENSQSQSEYDDAYYDTHATRMHEQFLVKDSRYPATFLLHRILEYILQQDIDSYSANLDFWVYCNHTGQGTEWLELVAYYNQTFGEVMYTYAPAYDIGRYKVDMSDCVNALPHWSDYEVNTLQDWIDNFYLYFDNLIETYTHHFTTKFNDALLSADQQAGYVTNQNHLFPSTDPNVLASMGYSFANSLSSLEGNTIYLDFLHSDILNILGYDLDIESAPSSSIINKPSDIVMNILTNEMGFSRFNEPDNLREETILPDYDGYDINSIEISRNEHTSWNMGFSLNKKTNGKKLIEDILKETQSYPRFTSDGKFGLTTLKKQYSYDDINMVINVDDIINYKFSQTKVEDVITSLRLFYRYDYGLEKYNNFMEMNITDIYPEYALTGFDNYNINPNNIDSTKEISLKYHTDKSTVEKFAKYMLMNNCNVHNEIELSLSLNYCELEIGDVIHLPLINNETAFDIDYSRVQFVNGQPIYPLWIIMSTDLGQNNIKIKAIQLHYLGTDNNHQFQFPNDTSYEIFGNTEVYSGYNFTNDNPILNYNYNQYATINSNLQIPYFDINGDGLINVVDIIEVINHILGNSTLSESQKNRLKYDSSGQLRNTNVVNVIDLVSMVNIILHNSESTI